MAERERCLTPARVNFLTTVYRRWARGEAPTSADVTPLPQPRSFPFPTTYTEDGLVGEVRVSFPTTYTEDGLVGVFIWMNVR